MRSDRRRSRDGQAWSFPQASGRNVRCRSRPRCGMRAARLLGTIMVLADFGPIASMLMDPRGLDESGEVWSGSRTARRSV